MFPGLKQPQLVLDLPKPGMFILKGFETHAASFQLAVTEQAFALKAKARRASGGLLRALTTYKVFQFVL